VDGGLCYFHANPDKASELGKPGGGAKGPTASPGGAIFLAGFNVKIAPRIGSDPITPYELAEYIQIARPKEAEIITTLARAKAELAFGNRLAACPLIAEAIRHTESPVA
jgi:hypothetical protein